MNGNADHDDDDAGEEQFQRPAYLLTQSASSFGASELTASVEADHERGVLNRQPGQSACMFSRPTAV